MNFPARSQNPPPRRAPPFAGRISADVKTVWISAGPRAWERGRRWDEDGEPGLVLPPGESPETYLWPVSGYNVALIAADMAAEDVAALVSELVDAGAVVIAVLYGSGNYSQMELIAKGRNV